MALLLSSALVREKNAMNSQNPFLFLLEIMVPGLVEPLRIVMNTDDIVWRGVVWQAVMFELEEISQNPGEVPQVELRVANPNRILEPYVEMYDAYIKKEGHASIEVFIRVINTVDMESGTPVVEHEFILKKPQLTPKFAKFTLGASSPFEARFPRDRILKENCRFKFKDARCAYKGAAQTCNKTLANCRKHGNSVRFGGFPGIGKSGLYITEV